MRLIKLVVLFLALALVGCSSSKGISSQDLCVTHINLNETICYLQERAMIEKVAGGGQEGVTFLTEYSNGLSILYRDDRAVLIAIDEEAKGVYKSMVNIGSTRADILKVYGQDNLFSNSIATTDYFYDSTNKTFIDSNNFKADTADHNKQVYVVSTRISNEGHIESIYLGDRQAVMYVN